MYKIEIIHNLLKIECKALNFLKSAYYSDLHNYHSTCKGEIGNKQYCKDCQAEVTKDEIVKGIDKNHILTEEQYKLYKEAEQNAVITILGFEDLKAEVLAGIVPFVRNSKLILPKTDKSSDITAFCSFKEAFKDLKTLAKCKMNSRGRVVLGLLFVMENDLIFLEMPYKQQINWERISAEKNMIALKMPKEPLKLTTFAKDYIKQNAKEVDLSGIKEEKKLLLETFFKESENETFAKKIIEEHDNPFIIPAKIDKEVKVE